MDSMRMMLASFAALAIAAPSGVKVMARPIITIDAPEMTIVRLNDLLGNSDFRLLAWTSSGTTEGIAYATARIRSGVINRMNGSMVMNQ